MSQPIRLSLILILALLPAADAQLYSSAYYVEPPTAPEGSMRPGETGTYQLPVARKCPYLGQLNMPAAFADVRAGAPKGLSLEAPESVYFPEASCDKPQVVVTLVNLTVPMDAGTSNGTFDVVFLPRESGTVNGEPHEVGFGLYYEVEGSHVGISSGAADAAAVAARSSPWLSAMAGLAGILALAEWVRRR